jgi:hypothetical protein
MIPSLAMAIVALGVSSGEVRADNTGGVRVHLSAEGDSRAPELLLEHDGVVVRSCVVSCEVIVPEGRYRLHVVRGGDQFVHRLDVAGATDVHWQRGAVWRKWVGMSVGVGASLFFAYESLGHVDMRTGETSWNAPALTISAVVAAGGFVLFALPGSGAHIDVSRERAPAPAAMVVPMRGGAALVLGGAF